MEDSINDYAHITNKTTLDKIRKLTNAELCARYITEKDEADLKMDSDELWTKEYFDEAFLRDPNRPKHYKRPLTSSLNGKPLSYIGGVINRKILPYLPKNFKINAKNIIEDLERILTDNDQPSSQSTVYVNAYIRDLADFFTDSLSAAINNLYQESLVDDGN